MDVDIWLKDCRDICFKSVLIYLIGNKSDLEDKRQVTTEEGEKFAEGNNLKFYETSALNGNNIEEIFVQSATDLVTKLENGDFKDNFETTGIKIFQYPNQEVEDIITDKKKSSCC
jgi:GTPase SAR1 family protein